MCVFILYDSLLRLHSSSGFGLSNPLLLARAVDVVNGWSYGSLVVLLIGVGVWPLEGLGGSVVLHGAVALPCRLRLSAGDELHSSINT